jgi:3-oxoacyl-[acyl-carrier protein] reductase
MDLGLDGRTAIVCASSQGLGRACAEALAAEGVGVVVNGRDPERLAQVAAEIRAATGATVTPVAADITTPEGRDLLLGAFEAPDILVTNNAGPRPGNLDEITDEDLEAALTAHYWTPVHLARAVIPGMKARSFGRIVNITSAMVASPNTFMLASAGARTGMTAIMKAISRELAPFNVLVNQIQPERIDSNRQQQVARLQAEKQGISYEEAREQQAAGVAMGRLGRPAEIGAACAFLCAARFGYITGVNLRLDGGSYAGLL